MGHPPMTQTLRLSSTSAQMGWLSMRQIAKKVCLLEITRALDASEEWEERKERDKTKRYAQILTFINDPSQGGPKWEESQINFTVGVRGTIRKDTFFNKLSNLGVSEFKNRESIRKKVGQRILEMHDHLLKSYYQVKFNPCTEQDSFQLAKTEKQSRELCTTNYMYH